MPSAMLAAAKPDNETLRNDAESVFGGLLLALVGGRRLVALVGMREGERIGLLAKLARRLESDGMMVLTVGATEGVLVEDLIEVAGRSQLGTRADELDFEGLLDALEKRLDRSGSGVLMVDNADRLTPDTLRDLMDLSADATPSGTALQVLVSGGPELELRLKQADLDAAIAAVGTIYRLDPGMAQTSVAPDAPHGRLMARAPGVREELDDDSSPSGTRHGPGWMAVAATAMLAAVVMYVVGQDPFSLINDQRGGLLAERSIPPAIGPAEPAEQTLPPSSVTPDPRAGATSAEVLPTARTQTTEPVAQPSVRPRETEQAVDPEVGLADAATGPADPVDLVPPPPPAESVPLEQDDVAPFREPEPPPARAASAERSADGAATMTPPAETAPTTARAPEAAPTAGTSENASVAAVSQPPLEAQRSPDDERRILALLAEAEAQMSQRRLTTPPGDNALETLQELALIDGEHSAIPAMRQRMIETYRVWGRQAERRGEWDFARTYYQRALRVQPANQEMTRLLDGIDQRRRANRPIGAETAPARQPATRAAEDGGNRPPVPTLRP